MESANLIENLDHRKLLRAFLTISKHTVDISSDRILKNALSPVLLDGISEAIQRNVAIRIKWGREDPDQDNTDSYNVSLAGINHIKANIKDSSKLNLAKKPSHTHVKTMLYDSYLSLISSYNLLAFAGNGLTEDEITDELGIVVNSKLINQEISKYFI